MSGLGLTFLRRGNLAHPTAGSDYILSADRGDPEVFSILMQRGVSSDGVGITKADAAQVTNISSWFYNKPNIKNFDEFQYFSAVQQIGATDSSWASAFAKCTAFESITFPSSLKTILPTRSGGDGQGFYECTGLQRVKNMGVETIGDRAFYGCSSLMDIDITAAKYIGINAFYNCTSLEYDYLELRNLEELSLNAFYGVKIKRLSLGRVVKLPDSEQYSASYGDKGILEIVELPTTVTSIGKNSFYGYKALNAIICYAVVPPTLNSSNAFSSTNNCSIYVPDASVDAYKAAANWSGHASRIKPLSEFNG